MAEGTGITANAVDKCKMLPPRAANINITQRNDRENVSSIIVSTLTVYENLLPL